MKRGLIGVGCGEKVSPSSLGRGLGRGCAPSQLCEGGLEKVGGGAKIVLRTALAAKPQVIKWGIYVESNF